MNSIQLYNTASGWMAAFLTNGVPDAEMVAMFGTHHLPTAFTTSASYETVLDALAIQNPGYAITLS